MTHVSKDTKRLMTSTTTSPTAPPGDGTTAAPMTRRQVMESLSGILLGMFVAILASSIVSSSLPKIVSDLNGSQASYTWVVTSTLLAMTISTPIWGKLADLTNRKVLIQVALVVAVVSSALAGLSQNVGTLIALRAFQGIGAGGLMALATVLMTDIISPRERGKYMGLMGGIMAVSQIGGPLLGGFLTDAVSWRLNFFIGLPFAIAAIVVLQRTLHLPKVARRVVRIDYWGALLLSIGISTLLLWVTFAGQNFAWLSWPSILMVVGSLLALGGAVAVEASVDEPIIPLRLFKNRTFVLAVIASVAVGVAMFGTAVFLSQYMQVARGKTPTESGLLTVPMIVGTFVASTLFGQLITRFGRYKTIMVTGAALLVGSLLALSTIDYHTSFVLISVYLFALGASMGMLMQNLVLAVQNTLQVEEMGAGTSTVAFFRSLGGAIGVSVLGAILASKVTTSIQQGLTDLGVPADSMGGSNAVPDVSTLPEPFKDLVERSYGDGIAEIFLIAVPLALVALIAVSFLKEVPLGTKTGLQERLEQEAALSGNPEDVPVDTTPGRVTLVEETESTLLGAYEPAGVVEDEPTRPSR